MRSTNENLSNQLTELLDSSAEQGTFVNKMSKSDDNLEENEEASLLRLEVSKLDKDNMQLKMEVEKLYDEIGQFEIETKQLKGNNNINNEKKNILY